MGKKIGVLTSGGDCPGLNAAIRAISCYASAVYGWEVFGINRGTTGLIRRPIEIKALCPLDFSDPDLLQRGGTILGSTNKDDPFSFPDDYGVRVDRSRDFIEGYYQSGIEALIGIGGDGSMKILHRLSSLGKINLVTIPKTIDNDLCGTEMAIGHQTALEIATEALDRLQSTAASHQRVMILEVMGRDAGHIALSAGIAGGADVVLIPEIPYKLEEIGHKILSLAKGGRHFSIVIVSEAVKKEDGNNALLPSPLSDRPRYGGIGQYLGEKIQEITNIETRVTTLGHVQRGGKPCGGDRIIASSFGVAAVDLIANNKFNRMVAWQNRKVVDIPIEAAIYQNKTVYLDDVLIKTARGLGIYLGEIS